jgi:hypothetical protein
VGRGFGLVAVVLGVELGSFGGVVGGVMMMAVGDMGMMGGHVVVAFPVVPCGFAMMACGMFVVFGGAMMMLGCFFGHVILLCGMRKSRAAEARVRVCCYRGVNER